ncbi:MerR family transcriptional regulator [Brevibacterium atlanticum]|uniref:MerR family transcriptional regulator n=1 Tax=Brevibacterium atlanticum TaxID=2697563 RepID=UPI001D1968FF|nr:MerR family transcriptional regulator [Brevibacterium atlanticum]
MAHETAEASPTTGRDLTIAEVSEHLGITAHTARYYERAGLIDVPRSQSGHRTFDPKSVERLDFLVRMRSSGMGISQLSRYVELVRAGETTTSQRLQIMVDQRERILAQIQQLELALAASTRSPHTAAHRPPTNLKETTLDHDHAR